MAVISTTPERTFEIGRRIGLSLTLPTNLWLIGTLGAGKTVFAKGLIAGLGDEESVTSPSFLLAKEHTSGRLKLVHIDLFRVENEKRFKSLGLEDYFDGSWIVVCEWADRLSGYQEYGGLEVAFEILENGNRYLRPKVLDATESFDFAGFLKGEAGK